MEWWGLAGNGTGAWQRSLISRKEGATQELSLSRRSTTTYQVGVPKFKKALSDA